MGRMGTLVNYRMDEVYGTLKDPNGDLSPQFLLAGWNIELKRSSYSKGDLCSCVNVPLGFLCVKEGQRGSVLVGFSHVQPLMYRSAPGAF